LNATNFFSAQNIVIVILVVIAYFAITVLSKKRR